MKVKRFLSIVFALIILSLSLLPASAAEAEQSENTITVYFDNTLTQWDTVVLYQWSQGTSCIVLSPVSGSDNVYSAVIDKSITDGLFKNINSISDWDLKSLDQKLQDGQIFVPTSIDNNVVNGSWQVFIPPTEPSTVPIITDPITQPDYDVTQISKYGFIVVVGMLSIIVGMMSAKAFSFWKW